MKLYAHPFSSYSQKVLVALYANATPFDYCNLEDPAANAELATLWPLKRFPVLVDDGRTVVESTIIIEHLMLRHGGRVRWLPEDPQALEFESDIGGMGLNLRLDRDGGIQLRGSEPRREEPLPEDADPRMREDEPGAF